MNILDEKEFKSICDEVYACENALTAAADKFSALLKPVLVAEDLLTLKRMATITPDGSAAKAHLENVTQQLQVLKVMRGFESGNIKEAMEALLLVSDSKTKMSAEMGDGNNVSVFPSSKVLH